MANVSHEASTQEVIRFRVEGMDCPGCATKIETAVSRIAGVSDVSANVTAGTVIVTPTVSRPANHTIVEAIRGLGYGVISDQEQRERQANPTASRWWQTAKGRLVLASGLLLVIAVVLEWLLPVLGRWPFVVATLVGLVPIAKAAWQSLRLGNVFTIEALMSVAALGALLIDAAAEAAVVVFLFAVGELLEGVASSRARRSISALADLTPSTARLLDSGEVRDVAADSLVPGDRVVVRPGDRMPCDGSILEGASSLDESPVSGESVPCEKRPGDDVFAGTVNLGAVLTVEVTRSATDNTIARIIRLVEEAQDAKAPVARFIDRFARYYMPAVVGVAVLVAIVPPWVVGLAWSESVYRALALLLIACPCALVISTPAAIAAGLSSGARRGLLIKGGAVLEMLGTLKIVALDKTGTLTEGTPQVTDICGFSVSDDEVLRLAAALERDSSHPIATAIVDRAGEETVDVPAVQEAHALSEHGVGGRVEGRDLRLISPQMAKEILRSHAVISERLTQLESAGKSVTVLLDGEQPIGAIAVRDEPREDAGEGLAALSRLGLRVVMLTGDNPRTAAAIGGALGIETHAGLLPEDKARRIDEWQAAGRGPIGKVGDGINDAPALAAADVGIAMGGGTDVALETADAALLRNRVGGIAELVGLSRATLRNVKTNVALALGFKAIFLVTTMLGITGMWIAVMADTGATVLVTLNAMRLLAYRFETTAS
ncbi:heavy metal translocating P-type ATPase [Aidingimonas lacisalsi]|uniref:heavy metal translocating P-type ATPase n=1 Tax=Aidingimonas lacisalsi TaxID=2604086 RepID=UPI0011D1A49D|nr:heavy metal translocating P-type ATPase [Aidingimonas lacisalsi]